MESNCTCQVCAEDPELLNKVCVLPTPVLRFCKALLTYPTECEEEAPPQKSSCNPSPADDHNQAPLSYHQCQPTPSGPPFIQQVMRPSFFETLTTLPSQPDPPNCSPPVSLQDVTPSVTVAGCAVFPMDPSTLAATHHTPLRFVIVARACANMSPTEEVTPDHSTAERVSGRGLPLPRLGLPVVHGDGLDCTTIKDSVTGYYC